MSDREKAKKRILDSYRNMSSQDYLFHLAKLGKKHRAHYNCPHCRGQDLQSELNRLRKREKILIDAINEYANEENWSWFGEHLAEPIDWWLGRERNGYDLAKDVLKRIGNIDV